MNPLVRENIKFGNVLQEEVVQCEVAEGVVEAEEGVNRAHMEGEDLKKDSVAGAEGLYLPKFMARG